MTPRLPPGLSLVRRTKSFTVQTVPSGLLKDHRTKDDTWGVIRVEAGTLTYRLSESGATLALSAPETAVVEPGVLHSVDLSPDCIFHVEFWR